MQFPTFALERWQSRWEHQVEINLAESGIEPLRARDLAPDADSLTALLDQPLGYAPTDGLARLREHVARLYPGATADQVLITVGCAEANALAVLALVEPGDEVVFLQPNYMQITGLARAVGAHVKAWWLREDRGWQPDPDELRHLVTDRTQLIALCNPNNPTGAVLTDEVLDAVVQAADRVGAWVLSDEVYRGAERPGVQPTTLWQRGERVLVTGGLSKAYGLPGLRIGWLITPAGLRDRFWSVKDYTTITAATPSHHLAAWALDPDRRPWIRRRTRSILERNYPHIRAWVERHGERVQHTPPAAGAIAWVRVRLPIPTAEFCARLRREKSVLVVPGEQFDMPGYLRLGYGGPESALVTGLARMDELWRQIDAAHGSSRL